jgi:Ca2+-transporting ATPase
LALCRWHLKEGKTLPLTSEDRLEIERENESMAGEALRVLGVASVHLNGGGESDLEGNLTWLGLVGMADPIRRGAAKLIAEFHRAQVDTVMITGDQSPTAHAVADRLKLSRNMPLEILDSSELGVLDPSVLAALSTQITVYSRVSPAHKLRIVQALQGAGKTVAMTGDGINDGPALKAANIGIALGKSGTDVARDVADIVLEEDDLEALIVAMQDGRATYSNIRKSVHFFLSTNLSEIMVMFAAMALGIGFPLNVMQLLWINIISDIFPGLALSMEPPEEDILEQPPRRADEPLISSADFKRMTSESALISAGSLLAYGFGIRRYGMGAAAGSLAFQSLTMGQLLHAWSCRSERHSVFEGGRDIASNPYLNLAVGGSVALQLLTMFVPALRRFLGLTPMDLRDVAVSIGTAALPFLANEGSKMRSTERDER